MVFARNPGLLARFQNGEQKAMEQVYSTYVGRVTRVVQALLHPCATGRWSAGFESEAELRDLVQEVFVKAFAPEVRHRFDGQRCYGPYLAQIARNVAVDHWRHARRRVALDLDELLEGQSLESAATPETEHWSEPQTIAAVERYVATLGCNARRVYEALYVVGSSQRMAAADLGVTRQVIRGLDAKIRTGLERVLQAPGQATYRGLT